MQSSPVSPAWLIGRGHKATSAALPDRPSGQWLMHNPLQINNTSAAPPPSPSPTNAHNRFRNATLAAAHRFRQESKKKKHSKSTCSLWKFSGLFLLLWQLCAAAAKRSPNRRRHRAFSLVNLFSSQNKKSSDGTVFLPLHWNRKDTLPTIEYRPVTQH